MCIATLEAELHDQPEWQYGEYAIEQPNRQ
jgi:hypothetical protein